MAKTTPEDNPRRQSPGRFFKAGCVLVAVSVVLWVGYVNLVRDSGPLDVDLPTMVWGDVPSSARRAAMETGEFSNIKRDDYVGPQACGKCHEKQHAGWSKHPHRWMNALASEETVKGDFDDITMQYRGGTVRFTRDQSQYRMELKRRDTVRKYVVNQTIGSRHLQFYVGTLTDGPEPSGHPAYLTNHVLPLGYELGRGRWMPATGVGWDAYLYGDVVDPFQVIRVPSYHENCIACHTTIPFGDWLLKNSPAGKPNPRLDVFAQMAKFSFHAPGYLSDAYPDRFERSDVSQLRPTRQDLQFLHQLHQTEASELAVTLGISCEACHFGGREHAENPKVPPRFFPAAPSLVVHNRDEKTAFRRTAQNINLICGRCHLNSQPPTYSGGMATYNSNEYRDAIAGACYSELSCVHCHNPHQATGPSWSVPREKEDGICLKCHQQFNAPRARLAHTHHLADSEGSRCMNCHMPRITEGLVTVLRTHSIFSPTNAAMLGANDPNACNLCHLEKSINWTLQHLEEWYGATFDERQLAGHTDHDQPAGLGWLQSDHTWTRMAAAHAITSQNARWALPQLVNQLDDRFIIARHILEIDVEKMLGVSLADFGYRFYQTYPERREPIERLREALGQWLPSGEDQDAGDQGPD